jgi:hypothetical protein
MATSLSTSSVASLSGIVLTKCYNYGCAVADAPVEVKNLVEEVTSLTGILVALQADEDGVLSRRDPEKKLGKNRMDALGGPLEQCRRTLQEIHDVLDKAKMDSNRRLGRTLKRLAWPLKQKDTVALIERLERQKATFAIALSTTMQADVHDIRVELDSFKMERKSAEIGISTLSFHRILS